MAAGRGKQQRLCVCTKFRTGLAKQRLSGSVPLDYLYAQFDRGPAEEVLPPKRSIMVVSELEIARAKQFGDRADALRQAATARCL